MIGCNQQRHAATLDEIGARFGVSRERVRQIEAVAIRKLRKALISNAEANGMTVEEWLFGNTNPDDTRVMVQEFDRAMEHEFAA